MKTIINKEYLNKYKVSYSNFGRSLSIKFRRAFNKLFTSSVTGSLALLPTSLTTLLLVIYITHVINPSVFIGISAKELDNYGIEEKEVEDSLVFNGLITKSITSDWSGVVMTRYRLTELGFTIMNQFYDYLFKDHLEGLNLVVESLGLIPLTDEQVEVYQYITSNFNITTINSIYDTTYNLVKSTKPELMDQLLLLRNEVDTIKLHHGTDNDTDVEYTPVVINSKVGRLFEVGNGSVQGMSKTIKAWNYSNKDKYVNWDIRSSQLSVITLLNEKYDLELELPTIEKFSTDKSFRKEYFDYLDIEEECEKPLYYSTLFGAQAKNSYKCVCYNLLGQDEDKIEQWKNDRLYLEIRSFYKVLGNKLRHEKELFNGILTIDATEKVKTKSGRNKYKYSKSQLVAFMMQGIESSFIFKLILECKKNNIPVYSYEFDGLVSGHGITEEIINNAKELSGFTNAVLEVKDFEDKFND